MNVVSVCFRARALIEGFTGRWTTFCFTLRRKSSIATRLPVAVWWWSPQHHANSRLVSLSLPGVRFASINMGSGGSKGKLNKKSEAAKKGEQPQKQGQEQEAASEGADEQQQQQQATAVEQAAEKKMAEEYVEAVVAKASEFGDNM